MAGVLLIVSGVVADGAAAFDTIYEGHYASKSAAESACDSKIQGDAEDECMFCNWTGCFTSNHDTGTEVLDAIKTQADNSNGVQKVFVWSYGECQDCEDRCSGLEGDVTTATDLDSDTLTGCVEGCSVGPVSADDGGSVGVCFGDCSESLADVQYTGQACDSDTATSAPTGCITDDDGNESCLDSGGQDGMSCGTVNGERVCVEALDGSECVQSAGASESSDWTCGDVAEISEDLNVVESIPEGVVPETGDGEHAVVNNTTTIHNGDQVATITQGTTSTDGSPLDGSGDDPLPDEGEDDEEPGFCDENPELCRAGDPDGGDEEPPTDDTDIGGLVGDGSYPNPLGGAPATCPDPFQFSMPSFLGGGQMDLPYDPFCDLADTVRPLVIIMGYLASLFIAVRLLRG